MLAFLFVWLLIQAFGLWERREKTTSIVFGLVGLAMFPVLPIRLACRG